MDAAEQDVAALDQKLAKLQSSYAARRAKAVEKASVAPTAERRAKGSLLNCIVLHFPRELVRCTEVWVNYRIVATCPTRML